MLFIHIINKTTAQERGKNKAGFNPQKVAIGDASNAYGIYGSLFTNLWLEPTLGPDVTMVFIHRSLVGTPPAATSSGHVVYDITDNGGSQWLVNQGPVYEPAPSGYTIDDFPYGRYPQGGIYNPTDNPADAHVVYAISTIGCGSGVTWCENAHGAQPLYGPYSVNQELFTSSFLGISYTFHINTNGKTFVILPESTDDYYDTLLLRKDTFNNGLEIYDYTETKYYVPFDFDNWGYAVRDAGIAFSSVRPDTGHIGLIAYRDDFLWEYPFYQLYVASTFDEGSTWDFDAMLPIPLNDLPALKYGPMNDTVFRRCWNEENPDISLSDVSQYRDSVIYVPSFDLDLVTDADGNPHVITGIHPNFKDQNPFSANTDPSCFEAVHLYSLDGGHK